MNCTLNLFLYLSLSFWSIVSNVFQCSVILDGSIWGPASPIHTSPTPKLEPFVNQPGPIPRMVPRIVGVNGTNTFSYFDNAILESFRRDRAPDIIAAAHGR